MASNISVPYKDCNALMWLVRAGCLVAAVCIAVCCIHRSQTCLFWHQPQEFLCIHLFLSRMKAGGTGLQRCREIKTFLVFLSVLRSLRQCWGVCCPPLFKWRITTSACLRAPTADYTPSPAAKGIHTIWVSLYCSTIYCCWASSVFILQVSSLASWAACLPDSLTAAGHWCHWQWLMGGGGQTLSHLLLL